MLNDDILIAQSSLWANLKLEGKSIKYNQMVSPNVSSHTSSVPSANQFASYITILSPSLVGHKVYAKITTSNPKIRLGWYITNNSGYDFVDGSALSTSSSVSNVFEGVYEITQDMVHTGTGYLQLYYWLYNGLPTGSHKITIQLVDLTELGMDNIINPVLFNATDLGKVMAHKTLSNGTGILSFKAPYKCYGKSILPSEYQRVEYIQTNGTQYIDSPIKAQNGFSIKIDFSIDNLNDTNAIFGLNGNDKESFFRINSSTIYSFWSNAYGNSGYTDFTFEENKRYKLDCEFSENTYISIDGTKLHELTPQNNFANDFIPLFAIRWWESYSDIQYSNCKYYEVKIYSLNKELLFDGVPCYRKSDNVIGLYDLVSNTFLTNDGTGNFSKGNDIYDNQLAEINMWKRVDLGSLNWYYQEDWDGRTGYKRFFAYLPQQAKIITGADMPPMYCDFYNIVNANTFYNDNENMKIAYVGSGSDTYIELRNDNYNNVTDFKNAMSGVYLYYETATPTELYGIKKASSIIANGNFKDTSSWGGTSGKFSISNNECVLSFTSTSDYIRNEVVYTNHKYFFCIKANASSNCSLRVRNNVSGSSVDNTINLTTTIQDTYFTFNTDSGTTLYINNYNLTSGNVYIKHILILDLTALGLDNLTAQQFYDLYKDKFDKLANGQSSYLLCNTYENINGRSNVVLGAVDLGTFNWVSGSSGNIHCFQASGFSGFKTFNSNEKANIVCAKYITGTSNVVYAGSADKTISISSVLRINDSAYDNTTDLATFKNAMSGVILIYELATPRIDYYLSRMIPKNVVKIIDDNGMEVDL